jgi:hypothetical protein
VVAPLPFCRTRRLGLPGACAGYDAGFRDARLEAHVGQAGIAQRQLPELRCGRVRVTHAKSVPGKGRSVIKLAADTPGGRSHERSRSGRQPSRADGADARTARSRLLRDRRGTGARRDARWADHRGRSRRPGRGRARDRHVQRPSRPPPRRMPRARASTAPSPGIPGTSGRAATARPRTPGRAVSRPRPGGWPRQRWAAPSQAAHCSSGAAVPGPNGSARPATEDGEARSRRLKSWAKRLPSPRLCGGGHRGRTRSVGRSPWLT